MPRRPSRSSDNRLPPVCVLEIVEIDRDGEAVAVPAVWNPRYTPPHIVLHTPRGQAAPAVGERVLARLSKHGKNAYEAHVIKTLAAEQPKPVMGIYAQTASGGMIEPVSRKQKESYFVPVLENGGARHGELVAGETLPGGRGSAGMTQARVTERLGQLQSAKAASLIAVHLHGIPTRFSPQALKEAESAPPPSFSPESGREDLRKIPLVTIDGEDARDFDDAVFAEPDGNGFHLIVAIADVAHYVTLHSALDAESYERGNSVYFPDRVVPMLPEALSNGLCSLKPEEERYCLAVHLWIDANGQTQRYRFTRAIMRSHERMTYARVQEIADHGKTHFAVTPLLAAYHALCRERAERGPLNIHLAEYKVALDESGNVRGIAPKPDLESQRLIESYMIAANVAAADFLLNNHAPGMYRVHETPDDTKLADLRHFLEHLGYKLSKGDGLKPTHFNKVLEKARETPEEAIVNQAVLRSQMQAYYSPKNLGHFGLHLARYCHFTSPIRRYSDLMVHRSIIGLLDRHPRVGGDPCQATGEKPKRGKEKAEAAIPRKAEGMDPRLRGDDVNANETTATHISQTERRAMQAERDAMDRYRASFLVSKIGETYQSVITGVSDAGLYVTIEENGITGYVPMRTLPEDYYFFDERKRELVGRRTRRVFAAGDLVMATVAEANALTGSIIFTLGRKERSAQKAPFKRRKKR